MASASKISKLRDSIRERIDVISSGNGNANANIDTNISASIIADGKPKDNKIYDYYLDKGIMPPWFEQYRLRWNAASEWDRMTCMYNINNTEDEQAYHTRRYFREHGRYLEPGETVNKVF
jgi:hypothetical protein